VKSAAEFSASVHLRAQVKKDAIRKRNRRIRTIGASAGMLALVLITVAVFQSMSQRQALPPQTVDELLVESPTIVAEDEAEADVDLIDMNLLLRLSENAGQVKMVRLNNRADEYDALAAYQSENGLESNGNLAIVPLPGQSETVQSKEALDEYLKERDLEADFGSALAGYDDAYFLEYVLIVGAIEIVDLAVQATAEPPPAPESTTETTPAAQPSGQEMQPESTSFADQWVATTQTTTAPSSVQAPSDQTAAQSTTETTTTRPSSAAFSLAVVHNTDATAPATMATQTLRGEPAITGLLLVQAPKASAAG
jgi:hypothetical protein